MALTKEKEEFVIDNMALAYYTARMWLKKVGNMRELSLDNLQSDCLLALVKAVKSFDKEMDVKFATYAVKCMNNQVLMSLRKLKRKPKEVFISNFKSDEYQNEFDMWDYIQFQNLDLENEIDKKISDEAIFEMIDSFNGKIKEILILRFQGFSQKEISEIVGHSQSYVSRLLCNACKRIYKKLY